MEQDCKYVVDNDGKIQFDSKTGEPYQNCKTSKSDFVVAIETIERLAEKVLPVTEKVTGSVVSNTVDCKTCKN